MHLINTIKDVILVPIHPKGKIFVAGAALIALVLFQFSGYAGILGVVLTLFCTYFFRNPDRMVPQGDGFVLSTGDGVVSHISSATLPPQLEGDDTEFHKVSIFLNVFNVHVNRVPASGIVKQHHYIPGKFLNADLDKASEENERTISLMETTNGDTIGFGQIAGLVARRIIHEIRPDQRISQGDRYGLIRFGSRCDLYIPKKYKITVDIGSICIGGETMVAIDPTTFDADNLSWVKS